MALPQSAQYLGVKHLPHSDTHTLTEVVLKRTCTLVCTCGGLNVYFMEVEVVSKIAERNSVKLLLKCFGTIKHQVSAHNLSDIIIERYIVYHIIFNTSHTCNTLAVYTTL